MTNSDGGFQFDFQQIENLILSPRISQRTMDINAAVAFLAVLAFGSLFGAFGAFLALPVTASLQAIFRAYTKRYDLIDSPLMNDPEPDHQTTNILPLSVPPEKIPEFHS